MKKQWLIPLLCLSLLLTGACSADQIAAEPSEEYFTRRDLNAAFEEESCIRIELTGESARCDHPSVLIDGGTVTITDEGDYLLTGTLDDGMIIVHAEKEDKPRLIFQNAAIHCATSAPLYILQADKVVLTLAENTQNSLSNGGTFLPVDENNIDAVLFSKEDLTFNGAGALSVSSPAGHGVVSKDDLVVAGGVYVIDAAGHGLSAKDSVRITHADLTVTAGKDGVHAAHDEDAELGFLYLESGQLHITAQGDGLSASGYALLLGGEYYITTGDGSENVEKITQSAWGRQGNRGGRGGNTASAAADDTSRKGIKAAGNLTLSGGVYDLDTADDALHSNADLTLSGGVYAISTGDDGLHADGALLVSGGQIDIAKSYEGLEGKSIQISGGEMTVLASDDGLNAAGGKDQSGLDGDWSQDRFGGVSSEDYFIRISGGDIRINAQGDGIDSNGTVEITGGLTLISGPESGADCPMDYAISATVSGGTFLAAGGEGMAQHFSRALNQGALFFSIPAADAAAIVLEDAAGSPLFSQTVEKRFSCILLSCPQLQLNQSYTLRSGNFAQTFTLNQLLYSQGTAGGMNFPGQQGWPGGFGGGGHQNRPGNQGGRGGQTPPDGMAIPNGMTPPDGMTFPDGMTSPDGMAFPDGMTPPDGMAFPDGMTPPDGMNFPDGMTSPDATASPDDPGES